LDALALAVLALITLLLPAWSARRARPAVVNFGPNDFEYARGFRDDWERDRLTRFHWTTRSASVRLPLALDGSGHRLSLRVRRHLIEPAQITLRAQGRVVTTFEIQAEARTAYRTITVDLPEMDDRAPFVLGIDAASADPRPLGIAIDWLEIARTSGAARFALLVSTRLALVALVLLAYGAPRLAGASTRASSLHAGAVLAAATAGCFWDVLAAERIVGHGVPVYLGVALVAVGLARWRRSRAALQVPDAGPVAGLLVIVVLAALAVRLVILLHPQFYYPDVRVHALFAWQLARRGLVEFLRHFTENQYRYSLGLQMEHGHWYAFPYPPAFYVLCWPLVALARMRQEIAVSVLAAAVNSLEALLVFGIARRLRAGAGTALAAAAVVVVLPLFLARLSLAYFPAMVGHAVDAIVILYWLARMSRLDRPRVVLALAALIAVALLTYTQSLLNFAVLLPLFVVARLAGDRSRDARRQMIGLLIAGALGGVLSLAVFYGRYVPIFIGMQRGVPMPEEQILQEKPSTPVPEEELAPQEPDDPYAGPTLDPWRGVRKAGWRLYVFYGPFAPFVLAGIVLVSKGQPIDTRAFVLAWALAYLALNLLSGGLPGPNLVRYNKDLEVVAPLFCLALAAVAEWLWVRSRGLAVLYATSYLAFGATRAVRYLTEKFILER
jgi:hypothetical protein